VLADDGKGRENPLHLMVEIKGYRGEDAKEKWSTMLAYWVFPGVNRMCTYGQWAFAEFGDLWEIQADFKSKVEEEFGKMVKTATGDVSPLAHASG
jgi:type III restriction enzyme